MEKEAGKHKLLAVWSITSLALVMACMALAVIACIGLGAGWGRLPVRMLALRSYQVLA